MARNTATKNTEMSRQAGRAKATDSTIAALPGKTTSEAVRAPRAAGLKTGNKYTAQYLYDRFVNNATENKADLTKMEMVQDMMHVMDLGEFDATVNGMVGFAKRAKDMAIEAAKAAGNYDSENPTMAIREAVAQLRTAANHQTVMRTAYGALQFCAKELDAKLNGSPLTYRMIREIGSKLLSDKGINWKGEKVASPTERANRKEQELETAAMLEVQKANPRKEGESRADYFARIDQETEAKMQELRSADRIKALAKMVDKIRADAGADLPDLIELLMNPPKVEPKAANVAAVQAQADKNLH